MGDIKYSKIVTFLGSWIKEHPILLALGITGYFSVAGLVHISMRLPPRLAIRNGWLDVEDLLSVGVALPQAWNLLLSAIGIVILSAVIEYIFNKILSSKLFKSLSKGWLSKHAAIATLVFSILVIALISRLFFQEYYPWPYAGVVTRSKVIYGTVPQLKNYEDFVHNETAIVHLIILNKWVVFQYVEDVVETSEQEKERINALPMNWGGIKKKGYLAIPISSIDSMFLEERKELKTVIIPNIPNRES